MRFAKLIFGLIVLLSLYWSITFTYCDFNKSGIIFLIGESFYMVSFVVLILGLLPFLIFEVIKKYKNKVTIFDMIYYCILSFWVINYYFNRSMDWIMD